MSGIRSAQTAPDRGKPRLTREIWAWAFYDWANSAFAVSVLAVTFQMYFIHVLATSGTDASGALIRSVHLFGVTLPSGTLWAWSVAISMIVVVVMSPIIGAVADHGSKKKRFLFFFCYTGATATMLMVSLGTGMWQLGMLLFIISNICFVSGNVVYNGLLTDVATREEEVSFTSGFGWGLGYAASFIVLLANFALIHFEYPSKEWAVRLSLLGVGIWWALFAIPTFLWVRERPRAGGPEKGVQLLTAGFRQLGRTLRILPRHSQLLLFMVAFFLYNDGIQTIISQAGSFTSLAFGAELGQIMPAFLMIQFVAFIGSLAFIRIERSIGTKAALLGALVVWILLIAWALIMKSLAEFYVLAFLGGLVLGVSQSASRTLYTWMIPKGHSAEFFSLYAIVGKVASLVGPILFGFGVLLAGRLENVPVLNKTAAAIFPLFLMVLVGTLLLSRVDVTRGKKQAES